MHSLNVEHQYVQTNGVTLHLVTAGPVDGPPAILLHGFPECWFGWHNQIPALVDAGFRVIVPDQRGYNLSDKPQGVSAYRINKLALDIIGLMDAFNYETVYLAGHDWGAAVAWWLADKYPERLRKLAILNVPHPVVLAQSIRKGNVQQLRRSWYVYFFQLPWLPELLLRLSGKTMAWNLLRLSSYRDTFSDEDIGAYQRAWAQPGALTGMVNWYRAALGVFFRLPDAEPGMIQTPTLMLWGERDVALGKELAQPSIDLCANGRLIFFPKATHWVQHDAATAVNQNLIDFFTEHPATPH